MRKLALLAIPVLGIGLLLAACGGGNSSKTVDVPGVGQVKVSTGDQPPSDFPSDFPIYSGAKYNGGVSTTEEGISGFYATWQTGDSTDKVLAFYNDAFDNGAWKKTATVNSGSDGAFISVERKDDASKVGFVTVSNDGSNTQIGIIVGDNPSGSDNSDTGKETPTESSGSSSDSTPSSSDSGSASLPPEVNLSSDFPSDRVPLPSDIRITATNSVTSSGSEVHQVEFYSKQSADDLANYFKTEMPKHNWAQALSTDSADGKFITYAGSNDEVLSLQITTSDVSGYQQVTLIVTVKSG